MTINVVTDLSSNKKQEINKFFNIILMIIDKYTKVLKYIPYRKNLDILDLAKLLIDNVYNKFNTLEVLFSDRQNTFIRTFFTSFCYFIKI